MSFLLWVDEKTDKAIDLGSPFAVFRSFLEMGKLHLGGDYPDLFRVPLLGEQTIALPDLRRIRDQARKFSSKHGDEVGEHTKWILKKLSGYAGGKEPKSDQAVEKGSEGKGKTAAIAEIVAGIFGKDAIKWIDEIEQEVHAEARGNKKSGYTGQLTDKVGRTFFFIDGKRVPKNHYESARGKIKPREPRAGKYGEGKHTYETVKVKSRRVMGGKKNRETMSDLIVAMAELSLADLLKLAKELKGEGWPGAGGSPEVVAKLAKQLGVLFD